jgi:hypothetical protein
MSRTLKRKSAKTTKKAGARRATTAKRGTAKRSVRARKAA